MFLANGGVPTCKDEYNILIFQVLSLLTTEIFYMNISIIVSDKNSLNAITCSEIKSPPNLEQVPPSLCASIFSSLKL